MTVGNSNSSTNLQPPVKSSSKIRQFEQNSRIAQDFNTHSTNISQTIQSNSMFPQEKTTLEQSIVSAETGKDNEKYNCCGENFLTFKECCKHFEKIHALNGETIDNNILSLEVQQELHQKQLQRAIAFSPKNSFDDKISILPTHPNNSYLTLAFQNNPKINSLWASQQQQQQESQPVNILRSELDHKNKQFISNNEGPSTVNFDAALSVLLESQADINPSNEDSNENILQKRNLSMAAFSISSYLANGKKFRDESASNSDFYNANKSNLNNNLVNNTNLNCDAELNYNVQITQFLPENRLLMSSHLPNSALFCGDSATGTGSDATAEKYFGKILNFGGPVSQQQQHLSQQLLFNQQNLQNQAHQQQLVYLQQQQHQMNFGREFTAQPSSTFQSASSALSIIQSSTAHTPTIIKVNAPELPKPTSDFEESPNNESTRLYRCLHEGCGKNYKNSNGLKYHLAHYHIDPNIENKFECSVSGCEKIYKNLNGYKYHLKKTHPEVDCDEYISRAKTLKGIGNGFVNLSTAGNVNSSTVNTQQEPSPGQLSKKSSFNSINLGENASVNDVANLFKDGEGFNFQKANSGNIYLEKRKSSLSIGLNSEKDISSILNF
ncbi:hypothetical protein HK099_004041 [Clydaea vesicula]|uniref:C2H2-type domain-containing protein n=1 Tax=Clydaea vesicula TaxID=447962 RepID=A0AAD5XVX0_9FUNG|nr:hypothetical protein HK099_004041 [Clydaea vesicula]KAJ3382692.1 hypothetical protein HDU92_004630 [Lobulomyces angularis]